MDDEDIYDQAYLKKQLRERKERLRKGLPEKIIELDYLFEDSFSAPHTLTRQDVDELTGH